MYRQFCMLGPVLEGELLITHDKHKNILNISTTCIAFLNQKSQKMQTIRK